jgi:hypothetical protein
MGYSGLQSITLYTRTDAGTCEHTQINIMEANLAIQINCLAFTTV